jgi:hypothetical protein
MLVRVVRSDSCGLLKSSTDRRWNACAFAAAFICCAAVAGCGGDSSSDTLPVSLGSVGATGGQAAANSAAGTTAGNSGSSSTLGFGGYGANAGYVSGGGSPPSGGSSGGSVFNGGSGVESGSGGSGGSGAQPGSVDPSSGPTLAGAGCLPLSGAPPTWSSIWGMYGFSSSCHRQASSAASAYTWLQQLGQISGTRSPIATAYTPLVVQNTSVLTLFGGDMPQRGPMINPTAKCALVAWVVAGAPNN